MEDKILGVQFELVSTKRTCLSYGDGSDQDELEALCDILSPQE